MALILFPSLPFSLREIDPDFAAEQQAAREAGFAVALLDHTRLTTGEYRAALAAIPRATGTAVYRGWMLTPDQYRTLYEELMNRGVALLNTPVAYETCHYLPANYPLIRDYTAESVWLPLPTTGVDFTAIAQLLAPFGANPLIIKDYVKSQKHYWQEACLIPDATDQPAVRRVVNRFLELQGQELNVGLVFRRFLPLQVLGRHPQSGAPLAAEFRIFWFDGEPLLAHRYWGALTTVEVALPLTTFQPVAARIPSRFFTMDIARLENGSWTIVELGDGQVAGLPDEALAPAFFQALRAYLR